MSITTVAQYVTIEPLYSSKANEWPDEKFIGGRLYAQHNSVRNDRIRRVRPANLRENPTALPTQQRTFQQTTLAVDLISPVSGKGLFEIYPRGGAGVFGHLGFLAIPALPVGRYINDLRNQIKDVQGYNVAEDLFEYRKTADLATSVVKAVARGYRFYRAARRGDVLEMRLLARRPLTVQSIAKAHLAASWGVVPLVNGLQESMSMLNAELMHDARYWKRFTAKSKYEHAERKSMNGYDYDNYEKATERAVLWVKFRPDAINQVQFGNILELGWNLTSLTQIVDWFIPVGEALSALDAPSGVEKAIGTVTRKTYVSQKARYTPFMRVVSGFKTARISHRWQVRQVQTHSRSVLNGIPAATLPHWDPSLSWKKLSLAVAVLVGLRGGARSAPHTDPSKPLPGADVRRLARKAARQRSDALNGKRPRAERDIWEGRFD